MKTEILTNQDFQPIELKITIETKRELEFLLALFNQPSVDMRDFINNYLRIGMKDFECYEINNHKILIYETLSKQLKQ